MQTLDSLAAPRPHDVCVVGAGPIGISLALALAERGKRVLLLESGLREPSQDHIDLGRAAELDPARHTPLQESNCRALGGTSYWWGGRCVPFDPIDFETRPWIPNASWPISHQDVSRWHSEAAAYFGLAGEFSFLGPWPTKNGVQFDALERWCTNSNMGNRHYEKLASSTLIETILDATVVDLGFNEDATRITSVTIASKTKRITFEPPCIVLACGGIQTPRLMLNLQQKNPRLFGGKDGPLGRYYMGHIFGKIADIALTDPKHGAQLDFFLNGGGFARRRMTLTADLQREAKIPNVSFSGGNAVFHDPSHRSGTLSLVWLMLASPIGKKLLPDALRRHYLGEGKKHYGAHIGNVVLGAIPTAYQAVKLVYEKYVKKPGKPTLFLRTRGGRYAVHYHAEQTPEADNRITLSDEKDALGLARVNVRHFFSEADADAIVRAHHVLDEALQANGVAKISFRADDKALRDMVLKQARDGMHQVGAARMSDDPKTGVVDRDCKVHGVSNLFVASTCVFPTSGQANPTFLGVSLALRLAEHLTASASVRTDDHHLEAAE